MKKINAVFAISFIGLMSNNTLAAQDDDLVLKITDTNIPYAECMAHPPHSSIQNYVETVCVWVFGYSVTGIKRLTNMDVYNSMAGRI